MKKHLMIWILVLFLLALPVFAVDSNDLQRDLKIYYSMDTADHTGNIIHDLANNTNATNYGFTLDDTGIINQGVKGAGGNGDNAIGYTNPTEYIFFTISFWFKHDTTATINHFYWSANQTTSQYIYRANDTEIHYYFGTDNVQVVPALGTSWHHTAMTFHSGVAEIYLDGVNIDNQSYASDNHLYNEIHNIGQWKALGNEMGGNIDEFAIWNRTLNHSEITALYNGGSGLPYPFGAGGGGSSNFTITAQDAITLVDITNSYLNATVNGTFFTANATGHIVTNITTEGLINITVNAENFTSETYTNWNTSKNLLANLSYYYYANASFSDPVLELAYQTIDFIINTSTPVTSTEASLTWNGTGQTATKTSYANYDLYRAYFLVPEVSNETANVSFTWYYNVSRSFDNVTGSESYNQTITKIAIDNCSTYTTQAINFSVLNEVTDAIIPNATLAGYFQVWVDAMASYVDFNLTWQPNDASSYGICINPAYASLYSYAQMEYAATNYDTKTYYFVNASFDNVTDYIDLYLIENTTAVTFTVSDQDDNVVQDVYINVLRYDLTTDSYKTVEILRTDENGQAIGNIILTTQWYKFLLEYDGVTVLETEAKKILTTTQNFRINLQDDYFTNYNYAEGVTCTVTFTNATNYFTYTFSDPTGNIASACLRVVQRSPYSDTELNESCLSTTTGTINYLVGNNSFVNGKYFIGYGEVNIGSQTFVCDIESADRTTSWQTYGQTGVFMSFLLVVTLGMVGIWSPLASVILIVVAFIITTVTGIFHLSWEYLISLIILGGITLFKLSRK